MHVVNPKSAIQNPKSAAAALWGLVLAIAFPRRRLAGSPGASGDLYVSGFSTENVVQFDPVSGSFVGEFVLSSQSGGLDGPRGLAFGPNGNLFLTSRYTHTVIEYDGTTGGPIGEFIPPGKVEASGWLHQPSAVVFLPDGRMLVGGELNLGILEYDATTGDWFRTLSVFGEDNDQWYVFDAKLGPNGNLFAIGMSNWDVSRIVEFHPTTGRALRVVGGDLDTSTGFAFGPTGNAYAVSFWAGTVLEIDFDTGQLLGTFIDDPALGQPRGIGFGANGNALVLGQYNGQDRVIEFDGTTGIFVRELSAGYYMTNAMAVVTKPEAPQPAPAPVVNAFSVASASACADLSGASVTGQDLDPLNTVVMLTRVEQPAAYIGRVTGDSGDGTSLTVDFDLDGGARMAAGTWDITVKNPDDQSSTLPGAVLIAACGSATEGNLFTLEKRGSGDVGGQWGVYEYDGESGLVRGLLVQDKTEVGDELSGPFGNVVFSHDGSLLVAAGDPLGPDEDGVIKYDGITGEKVGTFIPAGTAGMLTPQAMIRAPNGNLCIAHASFIAGASPGGVLEFDGVTGAFVREVVAPATCGLDKPVDLSLGPNGDLYVLDGTVGNTGIFRFDATTGQCVGPQPVIVAPTALTALDFNRQDGLLYAAWLDRVAVYDPQTAAQLGTPIPPGPELGTPIRLAFAPNGTLFVGRDDARILQYDVSVSGSTLLGDMAGQGVILKDITVQPLVGDADEDWDRDLLDFARLQRCFTGDGVPPTDNPCHTFDHDRDNDIDNTDTGAFTNTMTGPN